MRIAILGSGFAGLAMAWHLQKAHSKNQVTLIDCLGIGKGASGVSAGLMHQYTGVRAKKNELADEGFRSALELLQIASKNLNSAAFIQNGFLRLPIDAEQESAFRTCAEENPETTWLTQNECQTIIPGFQEKPGLLINHAISVYPEKYLQGLWSACASQGATFLKLEVTNLEQLEAYDLIIVALGAGVKKIAGLEPIQVRALKGQILLMPWPTHLPPLKHSLGSEVYVVMDSTNQCCHVGSTFERHFSHEDPDLDIAIRKLLPWLVKLCPAFEGVRPLACRAGVRMTSPNYMPFIQKMSERCYLFSGLGSKGLLYHSLFAERFAKDLF